MRLKEMLKEIHIKNIQENSLLDEEITGITHNSNDVREGYLFIAIQGYKTDGHNYISEAIKNGAKVILGERDVSPGVPYIQVENARKALAFIAKNFYRKPYKGKTIIGITGTNGKTTISYLLKEILEQAGKSCILIGSIENVINGVSQPSLNTTPSSLEIYRGLSESRDEFVIMEVSSHGIDQHRIDGLPFDYCLFTNLDHEHLDYHSSMENYFQTKMQLFLQLKKDGIAIINCDNPWGKRMAESIKNLGKRVVTIGERESDDVQICYFDLEKSASFIKTKEDFQTVQTSLRGIHNLSNAIMAYKTAEIIGIDIDCILHSIREFKGVKGRFEMIKAMNGATVIIDYAHTKEAVYHILSTARYFGPKRIFHIFGFRGNRDESKRKDILITSSKLSDSYILTFDDLNDVPEGEMIEKLYELEETYGNGKGTIIPDRTIAIKTALELSKPGDWIIITGKGHEDYQGKFLFPAKNDKEAVSIVQRIHQQHLLKMENQIVALDSLMSDTYFK